MKKMSEWKQEFYKDISLSDEDDDNDNYKNTCLITSQPLTEHFITLPCNHTFNYLPIYNEIINQKTVKKNIMMDCTKLYINQIKCPYCRTTHNKLIPYISMSGVTKIKGVNSPIHHTMNLSTCKYILKSGKNKGKQCSCLCNFDYCKRHSTIVNKSLVNTNNRCKHILTRGKNKGHNCCKVARKEGYCLQHFKMNSNA